MHSNWNGRRAQKGPLRELGVDGRIILMWTLKSWCEGVDWITLVQHTVQKRDLENTIIRLRVPYKADNILTNWKTIGFSRKFPLPGISSSQIQDSQVSMFVYGSNKERRVPNTYSVVSVFQTNMSSYRQPLWLCIPHGYIFFPASKGMTITLINGLGPSLQ